ncbi:MAG: NADH-quinone oxidoreductase subunit C [Gammaproteobacteria bacterium]|nr:NADH-quinone oxidoreductase subunit C [Gammaproteobacteria bacterium]
MENSKQTLVERLQLRFGDTLLWSQYAMGEVTIEIAPNELVDVCQSLRDEPDFEFDMLIDLCGVDYSEYKNGQANRFTSKGGRFAVVYHLLSVKNNQRLRVRTFVDEETLRVASVVELWSSANWFEREAFDLFGILFEGHPDLRRLLTDYGFIGHPFRKDFPLEGYVEMRYDSDKKRVVYEPVSIEPRINAPRVIRNDHRFAAKGSA